MAKVKPSQVKVKGVGALRILAADDANTLVKKAPSDVTIGPPCFKGKDDQTSAISGASSNHDRLMDALMKHCIIIPIHPPKSNWLVSFLTSLQWRQSRRTGHHHASPDDQFRVILAASSFGDLIFFQRLLGALQLDTDVDWFCVDSYILDTMKSGVLLQRFQDNQDGCVVNLKKLIALHWAAARGFTWALCIDSDAMAIDSFDGLFAAQATNYYKRKYLGVSGQDGLFQTINRATAAAFPIEDRPAICDRLSNQSWYMWFFDIPCYNLSDFGRFTEHMSRPFGSFEAWLSTLSHSTFDHILFSYWRVIHEACEPIDYRTIGIERLPENLTAQDLMRIADAYDYMPAWINSLQLFLEPGLRRLLPSLKLACHFDRMYVTGG